MGAPSEYYVDPSLGSDTGDGTKSTPWGRASGSVVQYALDTLTRDATDGDRINVKSGTDDTLAATLNLTTYGTPTVTAPVIIQGYTTDEGDGGIGGIDGNGTYGCFTASEDYVHIRDMHIHNSGSAVLLNLDNGCSITSCEFNNSTATIPMHFDSYTAIFNCHFHDLKEVNVGSGVVAYNYFKNDGTNDFIDCVDCANDVAVMHNIFSVDGATRCIRASARSTSICNNSILSASGTGTGIFEQNSNEGGAIINNLIEGFSGAGGEAIDFDARTANRPIYAGNAFYNNTADETDKVAGEWIYETDNESLGASPFAKSGADTFANRFTYFAPVDTGNVLNSQYPATGMNLAKGAVQNAAGGGSTILFPVRLPVGMLQR